MLKFWVRIIGTGVLLLGTTAHAYAQKATEMFIPLGESPGLSGKVTIIGKIETINAQDQTITVVGSSGTWSGRITSRTRIWLDRSKLRLTNQKGTFADLEKGALVEVKYEDREREDTGPAEWIKVQLTEPSAESGQTRN